MKHIQLKSVYMIIQGYLKTFQLIISRSMKDTKEI